MIQHAEINILETSLVTLSQGTAETDYPLTRLYDRNPGKKFKPDAIETIKIDIDQGSSPKAIDRILIPKGHDLHLLDGVVIFPDSITANVGTVDSGAVSDLQDADQTYLVYNETTGTPAFDFELEFVSVPQVLETITIVGRYEGNPAHNVKLQMYNYNTAGWDNVTVASNDFPSSDVDDAFVFSVPGTPADYYDGVAPNLTAKIKLQHTSAGNINHDLYLDYVSIGDSFSIILAHSDDDITYTTASVCTPQDSGVVTCGFTESTHRYWRVTLNAPEAVPEIGELVLTDTYSWDREAQRPVSPLEEVTNSISSVSSSGSFRSIQMGENRKQQVWSIRVESADEAAIIALFNTVGLALPFWLDDNGTWVYSRFRQPPQFTDIASGTWTALINTEEVIDS